jgi:hypothetical protein
VSVIATSLPRAGPRWPARRAVLCLRVCRLGLGRQRTRRRPPERTGGATGGGSRRWQPASHRESPLLLKSRWWAAGGARASVLLAITTLGAAHASRRMSPLLSIERGGRPASREEPAAPDLHSPWGPRTTGSTTALGSQRSLDEPAAPDHGLQAQRRHAMLRCTTRVGSMRIVDERAAPLGRAPLRAPHGRQPAERGQGGCSRSTTSHLPVASTRPPPFRNELWCPDRSVASARHAIYVNGSWPARFAVWADDLRYVAR